MPDGVSGSRTQRPYAGYRWSKGDRSFAGWYYAVTTGDHVGYESRPEREKMPDSVGTLFAQFVAGYTGRSTDHRGRNLEKQPLWSEDSIELLPSTWRAVNDYGIRSRRRTYDAPDLIRRQHSGVAEKKGLREVHHDPYDMSRIWVRNHHGEGEWIEATWKHLRHTPVPFGGPARDHAAQGLPEGTVAEEEAPPAKVVPLGASSDMLASLSQSALSATEKE